MSRHALSCAWCRKPIPPGKRLDARTCSKPCRQAWHRFARAVAAAGPVDGRQVVPAVRVDARHFGYADPPYPGLAERYYSQPEVDHVALVADLRQRFPDGWALSTSAAAVRWVHALCPPETRLCVWNRGARHVHATRPLCAWEALLVCGGRPLVAPVEDVLTLAPSSRPRSHPDALVGMKPPAFAAWLFRLLGAHPVDELTDLFPGSGAIGRAWGVYVSSSGRSSSGDASCAAADVARDGSRSPRAAAGDASRAAAAGEDDASRGAGEVLDDARQAG